MKKVLRKAPKFNIIPEENFTKVDNRKAQMLFDLYMINVEGENQDYFIDFNSVYDFQCASQLYAEGFIEQVVINKPLVITEEGAKIASKDGYLSKIYFEREDFKAEQLKQELENKLKTSQLKQLEFAVKTRHLPLLISILAFLLASATFIFNYFK